ncbi:MAG: helix-turn-helix domain-containing protein [Gammaproteobacteria bacterium]|nr:helix-turn-helix domain-containing protein [Gammaproteobacteria bacterium]
MEKPETEEQRLARLKREAVGRRIRDRRIRMGMAQKDLAQAVGVLPKDIWRYESGKTMPMSERLHAIAATLGTSSDELLLEDVAVDVSPSEEEFRSVREDLADLPLPLAVFIGSFDKKPADGELHDQVIEWLMKEAPRFSTGGTVSEWRQIYEGRKAYLKGKAVDEPPDDEAPDISDRMRLAPKKKP